MASSKTNAALQMESTIKTEDIFRSLDLNFAAGNTVMVKGASGIGKTDLAKAYAQRKSTEGDAYGYFELNCATASLPDVIGLQMPQKQVFRGADGSDQELIMARFAYPYFMRDKFTGRPAFTFKRGMCVLEEYGQASSDVKRALADIMLNGRSGEHFFCQELDVLVLSNRPEDRSGVTKDFDFLINRRVELTMRATLDGWLVWAAENGVSNTAMAFAARNTEIVFANKAPEKQGPWLTPRSLTAGDRFVQEAQNAGLSLEDPLVRINLAGMMSDGSAHTYIAFARIKDELPSFSSIIADPKGVPVPTDHPDRMMFIAFDLASKATQQNMKDICAYIDRFPKDFSVAFYRAAVRRDRKIGSTKQFGDWAQNNAALLGVVNQNF